MELSEYVRIMRRRWWVVVLAVLATAGSALLFSLFQPERFTSYAEVVVEPARPDWGLAQSTKMVLRTYMTVADSNSWAQDVIDRLNLPMTPERLRSNARFAVEDDRMVIKIEIEDYDGDQANRIAREWAQVFIEWRDSQNQRQFKEDRVFAYLRDEPLYSLSWPKTKIVTAAGAVFGLVIGGAIVFFLEWLEAGIVRNPRDVERKLGLAVVGTIPSSD